MRVPKCKPLQHKTDSVAPLSKHHKKLGCKKKKTSNILFVMVLGAEDKNFDLWLRSDRR